MEEQATGSGDNKGRAVILGGDEQHCILGNVSESAVEELNLGADCQEVQ